MLTRLVEAGLLKSGGRQRTDATHVLAFVRRLSGLELAGETLRAALEELAEADGDWLLPLIELEWAKRYGRKVEMYGVAFAGYRRPFIVFDAASRAFERVGAVWNQRLPHGAVLGRDEHTAERAIPVKAA
ncbi:hypothetical protein ACFYYN_43020 [Streptomyces sp. NPDC001902]